MVIFIFDMDFEIYSKLIAYIETNNSFCSLDYNVLGFEKHSDALLYLKSLQSFGNIFLINEVTKSCWVLTDKGKEFIRNHKMKKNVDNIFHSSDILVNSLIKIEEDNVRLLEECLLMEYEENNYIKKIEINSLQVVKGDGFSNTLKLSNDLTVDMIATNSWKDIIIPNYDYNKMGSIGNCGSLHVVYDFLTAVRYALFELGFSELVVPSFIEKCSFENRALETFEEELDTKYRVAIKENIEGTNKNFNNSIIPVFTRHYLRNNLFRGLISTIKSAPCKVFTIGKVFQNKVFHPLDIPEYHALEIMVCDSDLDLSNVLGICYGLFSRLNIEYTDFKQAYYPNTTPTIGIYLYNEILDAWIFVGEGGMIHPDLMKKLGHSENMTILRLGFSLEKVLLNKKDTDNMSHLLWEDVK